HLRFLPRVVDGLETTADEGNDRDRDYTLKEERALGDDRHGDRCEDRCRDERPWIGLTWLRAETEDPHGEEASGERRHEDHAVVGVGCYAGQDDAHAKAT